MKYCILGAGRTGQGMAAYLAAQGQEAGIWDRDPDRRALLREQGVRMEGTCAGTYWPVVFDALEQAAAQAEVLLVMTTAGGHRPLSEQLRGYLRANQVLVIFNGNMGAWECYAALGREVREKGAAVAETGGMLLLCDYNEAGRLFLKSVKSEMNLAAIPAADTGRVIERLRPEFPQFYPVDSVIETSLNNSNPIMHAPITLFNFTRTENGEEFGYYSAGASPCVVSFIERADEERCAVIRAMGATPIPCLDIINSFWSDRYGTLLSAIRNNPAYMSGKGPKTLEYRYITEDIPYGIVPITQLGAALGVPTPYLDALLTCYRGLLGDRFPAASPDVRGFAQAAREG